MGDTLIGLLIGWAIAKFLSAGEDFLSNIFHVSHSSDAESPSPSPYLTSTAVSFNTATPAGLPSWPSGWKAAVDSLTPGIVARAEALLPVMKMGQVKYEQGPAGSWLAYYKHKFDGKIGVTVHEPRTPLASPQPPDVGPLPSPGAQPQQAAPQPDAAPVLTSSPAAASSRPVLRKGSRGEAVKVVQRALGINDDGNFGKGTERAVKAFQSAHGLSPDGVVGHDTWAALPVAA